MEGHVFDDFAAWREHSGALGALVVHFWCLLVPKSSSKGGLGGFLSHVFLKTELFHETMENVSPEQHFRIENVSIFVAKIDPKSKPSRVSGFGALFPSLGVTFGVPWVTFWILLERFGDPRVPRAPQEHP